MNPLPFFQPEAKGTWSPIKPPKTAKQRSARAATKRQRKARRIERKHRK